MVLWVGLGVLSDSLTSADSLGHLACHQLKRKPPHDSSLSPDMGFLHLVTFLS